MNVKLSISLVSAGLFAIVAAIGALADTGGAQDTNDGIPVVKAVSPAHVGFVSESSANVLVTLEIIAVGHHGIETTESGLPRFLDPDHNATVLIDHVIETGAFTNGLGQAVTQLISVVPVAKLARSASLRISPPVALPALPALPATEGSTGRKWKIPLEAMREFASFRLQVRDGEGRPSKVEELDPTLAIAFGVIPYRIPEGASQHEQ